MSSMNIITKNKAHTVGLVSDVEGLKNVGEFKVSNLEEWLKQIKLIFGEEQDVNIFFKLAEDPARPAYAMFACHDGSDPKLAVVGTYPLDGKGWK